MLIKYIPPHSQDLDAPTLQQVKVSSRGLTGFDRQSFIKRASVDFLSTLEDSPPQAGEVPIHVIALGAFEKYGCFVAGTEVRMGDGSLVPIEQIILGDSVVDRHGRPGDVSTTYCRPYDGPGVKVSVAGLIDPIVATASHGFCVIPAEQVACCIDKLQHCKPGTCRTSNICTARNCARAFPSYDICERAAGDLRPGDYVVCPIPDRGVGTQTWAWSAAFARVFGYWLAEGSYIKRKGTKQRAGLALAFGLHELDTVCRDFEAAAKELCTEYQDLRVLGPYLDESNGTATYHIKGNAAFIRRVFEAGGEYSQHKRLFGPVYAQTPENLRLMIAAYLDGDGTCPIHNRKNSEYIEARYSATSASRRLILDLQWILSRLGIAACAQRIIVDDGYPPRYRVSFNNVSGNIFANCLRKHHDVPPKQLKEHSFIWNGYICRPIRAVEHFHLEAPVYNIEVQEDHHYTVGNGVAVKNSNRNADSFGITTCRRDHDTFVKHGRYYRHHQNSDPKKSYGIIKASAFNEPMARIELLVYLNGTKEAADKNNGLIADEEVEKLEKDADFGVSMSTRVPYDVCSGCGNKAKTRMEYCTADICVKYGGCRTKLGQTYEDGHTLHVDNPINDWFDISGVIRPADRIAYSFGKLASDQSPVMGGAELAEKMGMSNLTWLSRQYYANSDLSPQFKVLQKLVEAEAKVASEGDSVLDLGLININEPLEIPQINGKMKKLAEILTALSDNYCILPSDLFLDIISQNSIHKQAASIVIKDYLPGIFTKLSENPNIQQLLVESPYTDNTTPPSDIQFWAIKHASDWSINWPCVKTRIYYNSLKAVCTKPRDLIKIANNSPAEALAKEYGLYQVGFLARHIDRPDIADLAELIVRHNRVC